ncbi:MAG TPA: diguanylate cyclase [Candidatus Ozemobacteraceae bacterium]|nr:diguanylate cyclase [Candidatus Ozemobacteraceae bacterium]
MTINDALSGLPDWTKEFAGAITVCDTTGIILAMNQRACETFTKSGGESLLGKNLLDCHPEPARSKLAGLLAKPTTNAYTIEKNGTRKLIYQAPWSRDGVFAGLVELSLVIPTDMPHFVRK